MTPETSELIRQVRILEIVARRNAAALTSGDYVTSFRGEGLVFDEPRKYVPGQPARRIDWNITARVGEPYLRTHLEERQREVFLALDVSPSMHTGFQERTKLEYAVELAASLAASAADAGDRLGLVIFADRVLAAIRPRAGRPQLFRVLSTLLEHTGPWTRPVGESDPRAALHAIQRHRGRRFVVFLLSDFIDHDVPEDLKYAQVRHDVALLQIYDPVEYAAPGPAIFQGRSPEGPGLSWWLRPGETDSFDEMSRFLEREAARHRIDLAAFPTTLPVAAALGRFFHARRRRRRHRGPR